MKFGSRTFWVSIKVHIENRDGFGVIGVARFFLTVTLAHGKIIFSFVTFKVWSRDRITQIPHDFAASARTTFHSLHITLMF